MKTTQRLDNDTRRQQLISRMAPAVINVERDAIRRASFAITPDIPAAQHEALINHAVELGGPPGLVIGREVTTPEGRFVEILLGWERVEAFLHRDAFPHAASVPVGLMACNNAEAAFYGIEYAAQNQQASGLITSPLLYATAANMAREEFSRADTPWTIQALATALCIARPTLSNRLRLLRQLAPAAQKLLQSGAIKPEFAKILLSERDLDRQTHFAQLASRGMMGKRDLYKLVNPDYEPPRLVASPRGQRTHTSADLSSMERALSERYGAPVTIMMGNKQQEGLVDMAFSSLAELRGLVDHLERQVSRDARIQGAVMLRTDHRRASNALLLQLGANTDPVLDT